MLHVAVVPARYDPIGTSAADRTSEVIPASVPSAMRATISSTTGSGTKNHSRGRTGLPNRSGISTSNRTASRTRWISASIDAVSIFDRLDLHLKANKLSLHSRHLLAGNGRGPVCGNTHQLIVRRGREHCLGAHDREVLLPGHEFRGLDLPYRGHAPEDVKDGCRTGQVFQDINNLGADPIEHLRSPMDGCNLESKRFRDLRFRYAPPDCASGHAMFLDRRQTIYSLVVGVPVMNSISASARGLTARTVLPIEWSRSSTDRGPWIVRPPPAHPYVTPTGLRYRDAAPRPASLRRLRRACRSSDRPGGHQQPHRNIAFLPLTRTRSVKEAARLAGRAQKRRPNRLCEGSFERISSDDVFRTFSVRPSRRCAKSLKRWRTRQDSNLWPLPSEGSALSS